ncbi:response regulator [Paraburkholderia metrosideri]|uniref:Alkaline phosphatase synthesis transcriptional regulatory protein PhoP n=1 Tax=Paraburkholderia metrosideri TaxID=580937 RepID=A0ABM8NGZ9_9BURK|nr:response regulator [Paraburkholderia metrosideri]CAD6524804.1 Alkaline phosphatase synthesis transcriptional regulatory protein PhoP [Paraburkholderia metrosideri]
MKTILIVAGDTASVAAWNAVLRHDGCRVVSVRNGLEGLVFARKENPALIVADWLMPLMDGVEFCLHLKSKPALARIPLILTGDEYLDLGERLIWDEFWPKPVSIEKLRASVQRLLNVCGAD